MLAEGVGFEPTELSLSGFQGQNYVVRYKFKGRDSIYVKILTFQQFEKLKQDSQIEYSEMVK